MYVVDYVITFIIFVNNAVAPAQLQPPSEQSHYDHIYRNVPDARSESSVPINSRSLTPKVATRLGKASSLYIYDLCIHVIFMTAY